MPGGQITPGFNAWLGELAAWMPPELLDRLSRAYGTRLDRLLDGAESIAGLGRHFGGGLYERELRHLFEQEFARTAEDVLWRRTKLGLKMRPAEQQALAEYLAAGI